MTEILHAAGAGDAQAAEALLPLVYDELRRLAAARMARAAPGLTLQPTALVHEAWLRLAMCNRSVIDVKHLGFSRDSRPTSITLPLCP